MPSDSFEQLLDRAASWFGIDAGFWDIFGNRHITSASAKQAILRALGVAADSAADLEQSLAALEAPRMGAPAAARGRRARDRAGANCRCRCRRNSWANRAHFVVHREDGVTCEFELNLWELPQVGLGRNGGPDLGPRTSHRAHAAAAGISRGLGTRGRHRGLHTLHRDARTRLYGPAPGPRRPRRRDRRQPLRRALGAQLGLRRFPRSAQRRSTGWPRNWAPVSWRSIRCMPSTTGVPSIPVPTCRTASSTRTSSTWMWRAWRISRCAAGRRHCANPPK